MATNTTKPSSISPDLRMLYRDMLSLGMSMWRSGGKVWIQYNQDLPYDMTPRMEASYNRILAYAIER